MQTPQTGETPRTLMQTLYETDFYAWIQEQAKLLRHQQWSQLDLLNLVVVMVLVPQIAVVNLGDHSLCE